MRPRERRETGEQDLFRSRLDQIIDMNHPLAKLARTVDWRFLEGRFGEVYTDDPGHPPLPTRLMAGLAILKHTYDLSDEVLFERWVENPYYQYFCGEEFFQHRLVFDRYRRPQHRNLRLSLSDPVLAAYAWRRGDMAFSLHPGFNCPAGADILACCREARARAEDRWAALRSPRRRLAGQVNFAVMRCLCCWCPPSSRYPIC
jgi:hypothetical protein